MNDFDLKNFLVEKKITSNSQKSEIQEINQTEESLSNEGYGRYSDQYPKEYPPVNTAFEKASNAITQLIISYERSGKRDPQILEKLKQMSDDLFYFFREYNGVRSRDYMDMM